VVGGSAGEVGSGTLRHLVAATNAGEVIDRSYWGGSSEILYTCAINPLDCDFEDFPDTKRTTENDLLLTRNGTPYVHKPVVNAIYTNVVQRITLNENLVRDYIATTLQNSADNLKGYGVSIESLNYVMWKALPLPIPSVLEQQTIATFLDCQSAPKFFQEGVRRKPWTDLYRHPKTHSVFDRTERT
jgi:type I restriction enzyme S subunit